MKGDSLYLGLNYFEISFCFNFLVFFFEYDKFGVILYMLYDIFLLLCYYGDSSIYNEDVYSGFTVNFKG